MLGISNNELYILDKLREEMEMVSSLIESTEEYHNAVNTASGKKVVMTS